MKKKQQSTSTLSLRTLFLVYEKYGKVVRDLSVAFVVVVTFLAYRTVSPFVRDLYALKQEVQHNKETHISDVKSIEKSISGLGTDIQTIADFINKPQVRVLRVTSTNAGN